MLKKRVVAVLIIRDGIVVQSIGFNRYLPVGRPEIAVEFLFDWGIDEIFLLDITATKHGSRPNIQLVEFVSKKCFVPLTVGGGISQVSHVDELIRSGADKVSINHAAYRNPKLISEIADIFGTQCVVVSIDVISTVNGYKVYDYLNACEINYSIQTYVKSAANMGAGEIFLNSVDRDGSGNGFDTALVGEVSALVNIPVICAGGAGLPKHFVEVFKATKVHAAAAANVFHFSEHSVTLFKAAIAKEGIPIRHDTQAHYVSASLDSRGRLLKKPDIELDNLLYERIDKEIL